MSLAVEFRRASVERSGRPNPAQTSRRYRRWSKPAACGQ